MILFGFRGTGKSTIAQLVGKSLRISVIELDERLEARVGMPLPDFIEKNGEAIFRKIETEELQRALLAADPVLVVPGGGVVESADSCALLQKERIKILLHCTPEVLWNRLKDSPDRLRVGKLETISDLKRLWEHRMPKFRALATFSVDSADINRAAEEVSALIVRALS